MVDKNLYISPSWETKTINDIAKRVGDIDHKMPVSVSVGIPYIMTGDFIGNNELNFKNAKKISIKDYIELSEKIKPEYGDIIFARYASIGNVRLVTTNRKFLVSYSCAIIKPKDREFSVYLYYYLMSGNAKKQIEIVVNSGTQKNIGIDSIKNIVISIPTRQEYVNIAEALSDADSLIASLQKLIAKKKAIKQGTMQELLTGKRRLPGFSGEWIEINLAKKSKLNARIGWQGLTKAEYLEYGFAYLVTGTDFKNGKIDWDNCCFVDKARYKRDPNIQIMKKIY